MQVRPLIRAAAISRAYRTAFCLLAIMPVVLGRGMAINDDAAIMAMVRDGEAHTTIMSYPLSKAVAVLYRGIPWVPWYSVLLCACLSITALALGGILARLHERRPALASLVGIAGAFFLWEAALNPSVTLYTFLLMGCSYLVFLLRPFGLKAAWMLPAVGAVLLRINLWPLWVPLGTLLLVQMWFSSPESGSRRHILAFSLLVGLTLIAERWAYSRPDWKLWLAFNTARGIQTDFSAVAPQASTSIAEDDYRVFKDWPYDASAIPSEHVIAMSESIGELYAKELRTGIARRVATVVRTHRWAYLAFAASWLAVLVWAAGRQKWLFGAIAAAMFGLLSLTAALRDQPRVTFGVMFVAFCALCGGLLVLAFRPVKDRWIRMMALVLACALAALALFSFHESWEKASAKRAVVKRYHREVTSFRNANPDVIIIPAVYYPGLIAPLLYDFPLFDEEYALLDYRRYMPVGWLARTPYFREKLARYGAATFHELVLDERSVFLSGRTVPDNRPLLAYLDRHFAPSNCRHEIRVVSTFDELLMQRFVLSCE